MGRVALFECVNDNKKFKVKIIRGDPILKQYDGNKYNTIFSLEVRSRNKKHTKYLRDVVKEGMRIAELHSECGENEFVIEDIDSTIEEYFS